MRIALGVVALLCSLTGAGPASSQEARENTDRALKEALSESALGESEEEAGGAGLAFEIVHEFLKGQARLCERREGPRDEEEMEWLVNELLALRLDEAGVSSETQRAVLGVAFGRLHELVEAALRRDAAEGSIKEALEGSSLTEEELPLAFADLVADAEASGPSLLQRADELAAEENAKALRGLEVAPDPIPLVIEHLSERFDGRGLTRGELKAMAEPFTRLVEARREMLDTARFAARREPPAPRPVETGSYEAESADPPEGLEDEGGSQDPGAEPADEPADESSIESSAEPAEGSTDE